MRDFKISSKLCLFLDGIRHCSSIVYVYCFAQRSTSQLLVVFCIKFLFFFV